MRMIATRYTDPRPAQVKKAVSQIKHISAPLKGLSLQSKLTPGDPLSAVVLRNFVIDDDRISSRAGYIKMITDPDAKPIVSLIPFYGTNQNMLAATNGKLIDAQIGTLLRAGFTSDDWHWTSFSNLSENEYTVMVNGSDGVWSWEGGFAPPSAAIAITDMTKANPAVATVAAADIGHFQDGDTVSVSGATDTWAVANGIHKIGQVGVVPNTFALLDVDTSAAVGIMPAGITVIAAGSIAPQVIKVPPTAPWIVPAQFQIVLSHMNRLWFADSTNLAVYYLPLQQMSGELKYLPLNGVFRRGGYIKAMYTWTLEGGASTNDQLVVFSSNGEAVIYGGTDPDADFGLVGIFRFDAPMSKNSCVNYGGELYVQIPTGVVPMSTMLRAESEQLGQVDRNVISLMLGQSTKFRSNPGWSLILNPSSGRLICNMPEGSANNYRQMVRHMPRPVWSEWGDVPSRCWAWLDPFLFFGDDSGNTYRMHPSFLNDAGQPIRLDVQMAWSQYGTPAIKHFKMLQPYLITDGDPRPLVDLKVDYDYSPIANQPDVTFAAPGAEWDLADWDDADWATGDQMAVHFWQGTAVIGRVGGPRLTALVKDCTFSLAGWDVVFETGAAIG